MRLDTKLIPVGVLAAALFAGSTPADAGQRDSRDQDGQAQSETTRDARAQRDDRNKKRADQRTTRQTEPRAEQRVARPAEPRADQRTAPPAQPRADQRVARPHDNRGPSDNRSNGWRDEQMRNKKQKELVWRGTPRFYSARPAPRHYYGSGGNFSVYFGVGSGYRYGVPYSGRVYGYAPPVYSGRPYYGDVRLEVRPRNAAVYVDGYYAGIVDDFDGMFQRLTLTVGAHEIEIAAPGLERRFFNVYVDSDRTLDLQAELYR